MLSVTVNFTNCSSFSGEKVYVDFIKDGNTIESTYQQYGGENSIQFSISSLVYDTYTIRVYFDENWDEQYSSDYGNSGEASTSLD